MEGMQNTQRWPKNRLQCSGSIWEIYPAKKKKKKKKNMAPLDHWIEKQKTTGSPGIHHHWAGVSLIFCEIPAGFAVFEKLDAHGHTHTHTPRAHDTRTRFNFNNNSRAALHGYGGGGGGSGGALRGEV